MKLKKKEDFFTRVYNVVRKIPKGRATSYGAIANFLGTGLSARTVGWAMHTSRVSTFPLPAHRVVNRNGMLSGKHHFATPTLMEELLEAEGVEVIDDQIQNFNQIFWDPAKELQTRSKKKSSPFPLKQKKKKGRRKN